MNTKTHNALSIVRGSNNIAIATLCYEIANGIDAKTFYPNIDQKVYVDKLESVEDELGTAVANALINGLLQGTFNEPLVNALRLFKKKASAKYGWELRRLERYN